MPREITPEDRLAWKPRIEAIVKACSGRPAAAKRLGMKDTSTLDGWIQEVDPHVPFASSGMWEAVEKLEMELGLVPQAKTETAVYASSPIDVGGESGTTGGFVISPTDQDAFIGWLKKIMASGSPEVVNVLGNIRIFHHVCCGKRIPPTESELRIRSALDEGTDSGGS